jgi:WD40 repeat protein
MSEEAPAGGIDPRLEDVILAYLEAVDAGRPPDARELLAEHPDLASELRAFLDDQEAADRQARPLREALAGAAPAVTPTVIGDYELLGLISAGGMGEVYRARQRQARRPVAVKIIRRDRVTSEECERLLFEGQRTANLEHPHIVRIYEVGTHEGEPYFSMEHLAGTLRDEVGRLCGQPKEAARLVRIVALAVHYAHQRGILHRDLKPANVLLAADGTPRVADFGLAGRITPPAPDANGQATGPYPAGRTLSGAIVGTPSYMAPEQARGEAVLTVAVDVYGLGAILYECLTGHPPFRGATPRETLDQVLEKEPVRPRALNARMDRDLEAICLKCLEKEPAKRYADAADLATDLGRYLDGRPTRARRVSRLGRLRMWARREPVSAVLVGAVLVLVCVLLVVGSWMVAGAVRGARENVYRRYAGNIARAASDVPQGQFERARAALDDCPEHLRGWEWHFLWRIYQARHVRLIGHDGPLRSVCFSPDGHLLLTGSQDRTARLWDSATGRPLPFRVEQDDDVRACFAGGGRWVVTAALTSQNVCVWNAKTGERVHTFPGVGDRVSCDACGRWIATAGRDRVVRVFAQADWRRKHQWPHPREEVIDLAMSPNGKYLCLVTFQRLRMWDLDTGHPCKVPVELPPDSERFWKVAFSPDSLTLAVGLPRPVLWEMRTERTVVSLPGTRWLNPTDLAFSPDGQRLAATFRDGGVVVWEVSSRRVLRTVELSPKVGGTLAFGPNDRLAVSRGWEVTVERLPGEGSRGTDELSGHELTGHQQRNLEALAFSPNRRWLASRAAGGEIVVWDVAGRSCVRPLDADPQPRGVSLAFHPDPARRCLLAGGLDRLRAWDIDSGNASLSFPAGEAHSLVVGPPQRPLLAFATGEQGIAVRDLNDPAWARKLDTQSMEIQGLALDPAGAWLACAGADGKVRLWNTSIWTEEVFAAHNGPVMALAFSREGPLLATAGTDQAIHLWDPNKPKSPLARLRGHSHRIAALALSPDGKRLASGAHDGTLKIWDVRTGTELLSLAAHQGAVTALAFCPDGHLLATCGHDGKVRLWDGTPQR